MLRLVRMVLVRRLTPPVRPSRSSLAFLPSLALRVCSMQVSALLPHRHPRRSPRSGKRPATSAPRSSKLTLSQVSRLRATLARVLLHINRFSRWPRNRRALLRWVASPPCFIQCYPSSFLLCNMHRYARASTFRSKINQLSIDLQQRDTSVIQVASYSLTVT